MVVSQVIISFVNAAGVTEYQQSSNLICTHCDVTDPVPPARLILDCQHHSISTDLLLHLISSWCAKITAHWSDISWPVLRQTGCVLYAPVQRTEPDRC